MVFVEQLKVLLMVTTTALNLVAQTLCTHCIAEENKMRKLNQLQISSLHIFIVEIVEK